MAKINSKEQIFKIWLLIISALYILIGLLVVGLSIYFLVYKADLLSVTFERTYIKVSVVGLIVCGAVTFVFAFVGICGAALGNKFVLGVYCVVLLLVALLAIACAVMAIIYKNTWYIDEVRQEMKNKLQQKYGVNLNGSAENAFITKTWDTVQSMWYCCGVEDNSWGLYRQSQWYNNQPGDPGNKEYMAKLVPQTCCLKNQYGAYTDLTKCQNWILGPPNVQSGQYKNEALLYSGCFMIGRQILNMVANGVTGLGFGLCVILFAGIVPAALLMVMIIRGETDLYSIPTKKAFNSGRNYLYAPTTTTQDDPASYPLKSLDNN